MRRDTICPRYVPHLPECLEEGVLYISERFGICSHLCPCGCNEEVVTPLSPAEWQLIKEGELVSMFPSIGNWNYHCQSHYFIVRNRVRWANKMSAQRIRKVQLKDMVDLQRMLDQASDDSLSNFDRAWSHEPKSRVSPSDRIGHRKGIIESIFEKLMKLFS